MLNLPTLDNIRLFGDFAAQDIEALEHIFDSHLFNAGEFLCRQGDHGDSLFALTSGQVEILIHGQGDLGTPPVRVATFGPGEVMGELVCLDPAPRSGSLRATSACECRVLRREILMGLAQSTPHLWSKVMGVLLRNIASRIRHTNEQIAARTHALNTNNTLQEDTGRGIPPNQVDPSVLVSRRGLSEIDLDLLQNVAQLKCFEKGEHPCVEGQPGNCCYMLAQGNFEVYRLYAEGEQVLATLEPGSIVGQMALVDSFPRSANVRAATTSAAFVLNRDIFQRLMATGSDFSQRFQNDLATASVRQLRLATNRLVEIAGSDADTQSLGSFPATDTADRLVDSLAKSWNISLQEIDEIEVSRPAGQITPQEEKLRS
jgi:CRP/FNR family transcriptional regulator, cyclic AMP receptor protein